MKGKELARKRKQLGWSQYKLANKCRVGRFKISSFENGYIDLSLKEIEQIQKVLSKGAKHGKSK